MLSVCYKCKLHRPDWMNIDETWMKWCLDEGTLGVRGHLGVSWGHCNMVKILSFLQNSVDVDVT